MQMKEITLSASDVRFLRDRLADIQRAAPGDRRIFNLCRRCGSTLTRAERRHMRIRHQINRLLLQQDIINEIFKQDENL